MESLGDDGPEFLCRRIGEGASPACTPDNINTEQGFQYMGAASAGMLKDHYTKVIMDGMARVADNIMAERLWHTVKYEEV